MTDVFVRNLPPKAEGFVILGPTQFYFETTDLQSGWLYPSFQATLELHHYRAATASYKPASRYTVHRKHTIERHDKDAQCPFDVGAYGYKP